MKNPLYIYGSILFTLCCALLSCTKKEDIRVSGLKPERSIESFFGANTTVDRPVTIYLDADTVYTLSRSFTRLNGETLEIEPGTVIKVSAQGQLVGIDIQPGGKIKASGTIDKPIVFTSADPKGSQAVNWGGITLQGRAARNDQSISNADPNHNAGALQYVRIEFAPLRLHGVGSGTQLDHIMVSYAGKSAQGSEEPAFQILGGTFKASHLIAYAGSGWADFYCSRGFNGKLQFITAYRHPYFGAKQLAGGFLSGLFIENHPNPAQAASARPLTQPIISNMTILGPDAQAGMPADYRDTSTRALVAGLLTTRNAQFFLANSVISGYPASAWSIGDASTALNLVNAFAVVQNSFLHANYASRICYLSPSLFPPYTARDFQQLVFSAAYRNEQVGQTQAFGWESPRDFQSPSLRPTEGSMLLTGASFTNSFLQDAFFNAVSYRGAVGADNWMQGWTNFRPLETNYNEPDK